jgi:hypothetical protein
MPNTSAALICADEIFFGRGLLAVKIYLHVCRRARRENRRRKRFMCARGECILGCWWPFWRLEQNKYSVWSIARESTMIKYNFIPSRVTWAPNEGEKKKTLSTPSHLFRLCARVWVSEWVYSRDAFVCAVCAEKSVRLLLPPLGMLLT